MTNNPNHEEEFNPDEIFKNMQKKEEQTQQTPQEPAYKQEPIESLLDAEEDTQEEHAFQVPKHGKLTLPDPTDFTDVAQEEVDRRKRKLTFIISGIIAVFLIASGITYFAVNSTDTEEPPLPEPGPTITLAPNENGEIIVEREQPFLSIYPEAPAVTPAQTKATLAENTITTTDGSVITFNNTTLTNSTTECIVTDSADFCLAGLANSNSQEIGVYLLKDAAHSRFFDSASDFTIAEIPGAPAAATMGLTMANVKSPVVTIVLPNSSGIMLVLPENATLDDAKALAQNITVA